jgi:hypothetical protein
LPAQLGHQRSSFFGRRTAFGQSPGKAHFPIRDGLADGGLQPRKAEAVQFGLHMPGQGCLASDAVRHYADRDLPTRAARQSPDIADGPLCLDYVRLTGRHRDQDKIGRRRRYRGCLITKARGAPPRPVAPGATGAVSVKVVAA